MAWTKGDGNGRVVIAREGSAVNGFPVDYSFYAWSDTIGKGQEIGTGNFVVYEGTGNATKVVGLKKNTRYYFVVIEYNSNTSGVNYLTSSGYADGDTVTENITSAFTIDDGFQCMADNVFNYTNNSSNSLNNPMTYTWDFGDKSTSTATNPTYSYTTGGIFKVTLTVNSVGCKTSKVMEDTVVVPFITNFILDPTIPGNDSIQCLVGNNFKFQSTSYPPPIAYGGGGDRTNYLYLISDGQKRETPTASFKFQSPGTYRVKLYTTRLVDKDTKGCIDSAEKVYVVLEPPLGPGDVTISDSILCLGEDNYTFSHTGDEVVYTQWSFGDNDTAYTNPAQHTYGQVGRFPIDLMVTDVDGCNSYYTDTVEVITITDNFFTGLDPEYCLGDPIATLDPNLAGGVFQGTNVNPFDSTFSPVQQGTFEVRYIVTMGSCKDTARVTTTVYDIPVFELGEDTLFCTGSNLTFDIGIPGITYLWSNGANTQNTTVSSPGLLWGEANDGKCSFRDSVRIRQINAPSFEFGLDTTLCGGLTITLNAPADDADYMWNDGSTDNPRVITESGYYELTVSNACGTHSDDINITILPFACEVFVPNVFSPNADYINDIFRPFGYFEFESMLIFDRWGAKLYETDDINQGWDGTYEGTLLPMGTYFFIIYYEIIEEGVETRKSISGPVHLIR